MHPQNDSYLADFEILQRDNGKRMNSNKELLDEVLQATDCKFNVSAR